MRRGDKLVLIDEYGLSHLEQVRLKRGPVTIASFYSSGLAFLSCTRGLYGEHFYLYRFVPIRIYKKLTITITSNNTRKLRI